MKVSGVHDNYNVFRNCVKWHSNRGLSVTDLSRSLNESFQRAVTLLPAAFGLSQLAHLHQPTMRFLRVRLLAFRRYTSENQMFLDASESVSG